MSTETPSDPNIPSEAIVNPEPTVAAVAESSATAIVPTPVAETAPAAPAAAPAAPAAAPAAPAPAATEAAPATASASAPAAQAESDTKVSPELLKVIEEIVADIKKDAGKTITAPDIIRYIPRLAACAQSLKDLSGSQKSALVILGGHELINRLLPENDRDVAHGLVDMVFPAAIAGIVDVAKGRVSFGTAAQAAAVAAAPAVLQVCQRECLPRCLAWIQRK